MPQHGTLTLAAFILLATAGCAAPLRIDQGLVRAGLLERFDAELGPELALCQTPAVDWPAIADGLPEEQAAAIGLWASPKYRELLVDLRIADSDLIQAWQLTNPEFFTALPLGTKQWEFTLLLPIDVILLRSQRMQAADFEAHRVAERLVQDGLDVVRDVRAAHADLVLAEQQLRLAHAGDRLRRELARIAEARLQAGAVSDLDVSPLRLEQLQGEGIVIRAEAERTLAELRLKLLMGAALSEVELKPAIAPAGGVGAADELPDFDVELLAAEAVQSRADAAALRLATEAARQQVRLRKYDYFNLLAALPDFNSRGNNGAEAGTGHGARLPIFHQNQGAIARAAALQEKLERQHASLEATIATEVRQTHRRLLQAQDALRLLREQTVPQAVAAEAAARKALIDEDAVSLLLVLETTRQLLLAQGQELVAAAEMRKALAELERSVGRRLVARAIDSPESEDVEEDAEAEEDAPVPPPQMGEEVP